MTSESSWLVALPPANVDDRRPVPGLVKGLQGKVFGDRGYISQALFADLFPRGSSASQLLTRTKVMAVAVRICGRGVLTRPMYRARRSPKARTACDRVPSTPAHLAYSVA